MNLKEDVRTKFCGWTYNNLLYIIIRDNIYIMDFKKNSFNSINFKLDKNKFYIDRIFPYTNNKVISLIIKENVNPEIKMSTLSDIAIVNLRTNKLEWLTNDGDLKSNLDIFIKNRTGL